MDWQKGRQSDNVIEDEGNGGGGGSYGGGGLGFGGFHIGIGGIILIVIVSLLFGKNPLDILSLLSGDGGDVSAPTHQTAPAPSTPSTSNDPQHQFVRAILGSTEDVWGRIFRQSNGQYRPPTLVLYDRQVRSACGVAQSAMGPFYCSNDEKLYIDLSFFRELQERFHAPGDFAQAYVIAHEVGHHVQKLTGTMNRMESPRGREANEQSVRLELQADCYAGVWGHYAGAMKQLDPGDVDEALNAAVAIGDDRIQKQMQGRVVPETFTHGSSEQRLRWLKRGLDTGRPQDCETFSSTSV